MSGLAPSGSNAVRRDTMPPDERLPRGGLVNASPDGSGTPLCGHCGHGLAFHTPACECGDCDRYIDAGHIVGRDYYLVRVSREMVDRLVADDSEPVVIVRVEERDDGTHDMVFHTPEVPW